MFITVHNVLFLTRPLRKNIILFVFQGARILFFKFKSSRLLGRHAISTTWAMSSPTCFGYFWDRVSHLCPDHTRLQFLLIVLSAQLGGHVYLRALISFIKMGLCELFCEVWPQMAILLISAFQVARIPGVSYHAWPSNIACIVILFYFKNLLNYLIIYI
jgi:hypothetical protein